MKAALVYLGGDEAEGSGASVAVDATAKISVLPLRRVPAVGDLVVAHNIGGRWVSEINAPATTVACGGCMLPRGNLILTWTNVLLGTRSFPLVFNGSDAWVSACQNQVIFRLQCVAAQIAFSATYYTGGPCPTGEPASCTSSGSSPFGLTPTIQSCDPFLLQYNVTGCPALATQGFTRFAVTR